MSEAIPDFVKSIDLDDGSRSVFFECVANWLISQGLAPEVSMDPESSMFSAQGTPAELDAFLTALAPYLVEDDTLATLIEEADAAGHDFDD